jgi:hypothetical protein
MQQGQPQDATPPPAPQTPASTAPALAPPVAGVPTTVQELRGLRERREELSDQLSSAASRRRSLANQLEDAPPALRAGLEQRIAVLDARLAQLELDLAETGRQLTGAPAALIASAESRAPFGDVDPADVLATVGGTLALAFVAVLFFAFARRIWRGGRRPQPPLADSTQRLERIEQAIEAVAIEVERISEGQRFVTRLLSEGNRLPSLGAGKQEQETARTPER